MVEIQSPGTEHKQKCIGDGIELAEEIVPQGTDL